MSKHLLYRKDLLNRTLTRSLLFVLAQLVACLIVLSQAISPAEAAGPLSVKTTNPRFFDPQGKSVYLTGSYLNEYNLLSGSSDFASHLDFLQQQKQNFTRVWGWEQSPWIYDNTGQVTFSTQPYERTGPGLALDGALKFDLTRFNPAYFDQLRSRVVEAARRGIYVSVMLFEGFSTQKKTGRVNPWLGDPFQQVNNINGINGDPNQNGGGEEFFSLAFPSLLALQEAFARKVVDTLNDLDNVLYEVSGNDLAGSLSWQYHMIDYIKSYQATKRNQHPVGISQFAVERTGEVLKSSADWIVIQESNLNSPPTTNNKVLIMEGSPISGGKQALSTSPISLFQLLADSVVSSQSPVISNNVPSSNGVTLLSSSATSGTLNATKSSSNQQSNVATPTITPNGGVYSGTVAVTLQTTTPAASIYYTTDGQSPTQSSRLYTGKFTLSNSTLIKAKAFKNNFDPSSEASAWFANAVSPAVAGSGLVAYWKFDEGNGTTVSDSSGNGNTGTLVNGPLWTAGRVGNALYFDGIDDNVTVPDSASLHLSSSFTLSAWVNPASAFTDFRSIFAKNYKYYLYASGAGYCGNGSPLGGLYDGMDIAVCQPSSLPANTWTHLTLTYNGSSLTLYRNGVAVATAAVSATLSPTTGTLQIGASQFGEYFKGLIDEVRIYNRALSNTEIQTIYQQDSATTVQTMATPVISPNGGNYSGSVSVTMQTATSGASIYYTTNGSTPTQASTLYTGTMNLTSSATVKAKTFKNGSNASAEASASFTVTQPFSFSLSNSGDKSVIAGSSVTNSISTTLSSGSAQAVTLSASGLPTGATASFSSISCSPTCSSSLTINTNASTPAGGSTITVSATGGGVTKTTTFGLNVSLPTVAMPTISPSGGSFIGSASIAMQTATSGASIYYSTDGSTPTQSSTLYTGTMNLTSSATVKAQAFKSGYNASAQASASFTVSQPFSFSVSSSGNQSVVAGSSVTNSISATLVSGSAQAVTLSASGLPTGATASFSSTSCSPACSSTLTINTSSSTPAGSSTITVIASGGGVTKTTAFILTVSLPTVAIPIINPNGGTYAGSVFVAMQSATSGASIYYTTNGSTPTQSSTLYTGTMTLTSTTVVKAKAFKNGYNASAEASASFTVAGSGLVAYWKFDEGSGASVADSSGNNNTATLINGPLWTAGRIGNALFFDGIDDSLTIPDSTLLDLSGSFTLSAWVNPASTFADFRSILAKNYKYYLYASSTGFCGDGNPMGGFYEGMDIATCQPSPLPTNTWTHLSVTYNGSTLTLYRNGAAVATSSVSGTLSPSTGTLQIGGSQFGEYFNGFIDEVRIYNRALSGTEIQTVYQQDSVAASQTVTTSVSQPFNFSLSNSGNKSVVAGSSVTNSVAATLVSGSSQAVSFSVSGLPAGATGSFSSTSCSPACSSVLNISTSGSTPAGNFPVTVTSTGGSVTRTTAFTLSVTLALTVATPTITPNGGNFSGSVSVAMQTATSGASIYYTTDGSAPSQSSQLYNGAMTVTSDTNINATAFKSGYNPSAVASASFVNSGTGKTYYVAKTGNDSNGCVQAQSQSMPKLTIAAGIACLQSGDTLNITAGTYKEGINGNSLPSGTSYSNATTIQAYSKDVVTLTGGGIGLGNQGQTSRYIVFRNLIVDGGNGANFMGVGAGVGGGGNGGTIDHIKWENIEIKNIYCNDSCAHGFLLGGDDGAASFLWVTGAKVHDGGKDFHDHCFYVEASNSIIEQSECYNWKGYGIHNYGPNPRPSNNIYRYNWIHDNGNTSTTAFGIILTSGDNNQAYGNIVSGNQNGISFGSNNNLIYNNTIYGNGIGFGGACCYSAIFAGSGSNNVIKNNIVFRNRINTIESTGTTDTVSSNNLLTDPSFVNAAANDFALQPGSAAIDAGTSSITTGISITFSGSAPDIGALQY